MLKIHKGTINDSTPQ